MRPKRPFRWTGADGVIILIADIKLVQSKRENMGGYARHLIAPTRFALRPLFLVAENRSANQFLQDQHGCYDLDVLQALILKLSEIYRQSECLLRQAQYPQIMVHFCCRER